MSRLQALLLASSLVAAAPAAAGTQGGPSHPPEKGCAWQKLSDQRLGLEAWVSRCDFGSRKIDFVVAGRSLAIRYSDSTGPPEPVVDVFDLEPQESPEAGVKRLFSARTEKGLAARCVLAPFRGSGRPKTPAGVRRYTFVPDPAYARELAAKASPDEVGDPPCGEWGDAPDGIQYFEAQPASGARRVLFVRVGQDRPLFDERTLRLVPAQ